MDVILIPLIQLLGTVISLYSYVLLAYIILSWLESFGVLNSYNRGVFVVQNILSRLTEPVLNPIRRILPSLGGLDISPLVLILILNLLLNVLQRLALRLL